MAVEVLLEYFWIAFRRAFLLFEEGVRVFEDLVKITCYHELFVFYLAVYIAHFMLRVTHHFW